MTSVHFKMQLPSASSELITCHNLINGMWCLAADTLVIVDPLTGKDMIEMPATSLAEMQPILDQLRTCHRYGMHNPLNHPERYRMLGEVTRKAAHLLAEPKIEEHFAVLIQRVMPKSMAQCLGEVRVTQQFLANFAGDQVRFLATGTSVPGDHLGQESRSYRWPYGPVAIIAPFNFPLEIPVLQLMGALFMGNLPLLKVDSKVAIVVEQFIQLLLDCGLPMDALMLVHCDGLVMGDFLTSAKDVLRLVQFTGSSRVAEHVSQTMDGRVKIEDAGFDWKILGPDALVDWIEYVAWQCDQDAYAASGQKCSAQSICFVHENWDRLGILDRMRQLAGRRTLANLTVGPVLTWDNARIAAHIKALLELPGAVLLWGGKPLQGHSIPVQYGAFEPTAIEVSPEVALQNFDLVTTELFGPFQVIVKYDDASLGLVLQMMERMKNYLTAAVVSSDPTFQQAILGASVNGTTYTGMRARTTGAPQNHWFGPAGDPRAAGIGTPGAIISTWSCHREIISDQGPVPKGWSTPSAT